MLKSDYSTADNIVKKDTNFYTVYMYVYIICALKASEFKRLQWILAVVLQVSFKRDSLVNKNLDMKVANLILKQKQKKNYFLSTF